MQVDSAPSTQAQRARYSASPVLAAAAAPAPTSSSLQSYSFPPPPRTAQSDREGHNASPALSEYARPRTGEANFTTSASSSSAANNLDPRSLPEGYQQPRSMSNVGLLDDGEYAQPQAEFSMLGRTVVQGGPVHRVVSSYQFAEYMGDQPHHPNHHHPHSHGQPHFVQPHHQPQYRPYTFGGAVPPPGHPFARGPASYAAGAPSHLDWAKPRPGMAQDDAGPPPRHFSSAPHTPRLAQGGVYYASAPYHPSIGSMGMVRSTSNQSGLSSLSESTTDSSAHLGSDYDGVNPSFLGQAFWSSDSGYYSSSPSGAVLGSSSAGDLHGVSNLRLDGSPLPLLPTRSSRRTTRGKHSTLRASYADDYDEDGGIAYSDGGASASATFRVSASTSRSRTKVKPPTTTTDDDAEADGDFTEGPKAPKKRVASTIFHPTPQAMLAPGVALPSAGALAARKGRSAPFPGTNSPALPTDDEFRRMPTKRSRGRRPPCTPDLDVDAVDPNAEPSDALLSYVGTTKTGKVKKAFLCKVPGCGKVFKRSEHLKRHVRSIHTNERPFQCQWPTCGRFFSRHDNLNQHLRIHREAGMSDAAFSAKLKECFDRRSYSASHGQSGGATPLPLPMGKWADEEDADGDAEDEDEGYRED
ncbi:hypothetical protein JCM8097_009356 [Rhodosporidiobolus ruineniae]